MWLLAFSVLVIFSLCPLANFATRYNLTAGGPGTETFYLNAPVFVAGDINRSATAGSANTSTGELNESAKNHALFKTDGTVDANVFDDLLNMVDSEKVWNGVTENANAPTYLTAKNFGKYGTQNGWTNDQKGNAQILVKLFDTTENSTSNVNAMTGQYWQAVYRSINGENDVLTLYMVRSYVASHRFSPSLNNYSKSDIRNTILNDYTKLMEKFSQADQYIVAPYQLTSGANASDMDKTTVDNGTYLNLGGWQSSTYQTSYNYKREYHMGGASGYVTGNERFSTLNGMDGLSGNDVGYTVESAYTDKLWLPSNYEITHTGYGSKDAIPENGATGRKVKDGRYYDEDNVWVYLKNYSEKSATSSNSNSNGNRTGLWELNGYDRAANSWAWLRSGISSSNSYPNGSYAIGINVKGAAWYNNVFNAYSDGYEAGVRVALHLNLGALGTLLQKTRLNITATNNAVNSLLMLTIMDGDARLAEYSCISGTISTRLTLEQNKIYKILATRPFGSSLEVKLDDDLQSPTVFACYEISTAENVRMNISFTLTGDGSWKNCVVI